MDIEGRRQSSNIEDRRGMRPVRTGVGLSIGGVLFLVVLSFMGVDVRPFLGMAVQQQAPAPPGPQPDQPYQESPQEAKLREMTAVVLADTEETWHQILPKYGVQYVEPKLVLFSGAVESACGAAESAMGPFYCPSDQKVYIDMSFYNDLADRFGAPGDFAQAYVVAHEVGHHVQNLLGTSQKVHDAQQRSSRTQANALSVRLELQADCYAGVWARNAAQSRQLLEAGDVEEGLNAASAIGAPGDFAQAYVVAHEVGHHVQNLLGTSQKVHDAQQRSSRTQANALSVRLELQADCYAGVWARNAAQSRQLLEAGDVEEGLNAASAIGDDRLQKQAQGYVVPDAFTHGSSAQRVQWFRAGLEAGTLEACDTFGAQQL